MMKKNWKRNGAFAFAAAAVLAGTMTYGYGTAQAATVTAGSVKDTKVVGTILLSVNPEIEMEYNRKGDVVNLNGLNEEGKNVISKIGTYKGRDCDDVAELLVREIYRSGYLKDTVDGKARNIVLKLEKDSVRPESDFLEEVAREVRETLQECGISSDAITVSGEDYAPNGYITLEKAKELVLEQLDLKDVKFYEHEYDLEDGVYELEFVANGIEYEYEVSAVTGKIVKADYERNDDWKGSWNGDRYDDDRYDDDRYDDDRYDDDRYDDDRYDDDRYDDDRYDDDRDDDDRYDDDRYDDDRDDDDRYDDDRDDDDRYDDDRYDDDRDDDDRDDDHDD